MALLYALKYVSIATGYGLEGLGSIPVFAQVLLVAEAR
jgi:hypothetical protein